MQEIQQLSPTTIKFIDDETGAYLSLAGAVDDVVESIKRKRNVENATTEYYAALDALDQLQTEYDKTYEKQQQLTDEKSMKREDTQWIYDIKINNTQTKLDELQKEIDEKEELVAETEQKLRNASKLSVNTPKND